MSKESSTKHIAPERQEQSAKIFSSRIRMAYVVRTVMVWLLLFVGCQLVASVIFISFAHVFQGISGNSSEIQLDSSVLLQFGLLVFVYVFTAAVIYLVIKTNLEGYLKQLGLYLKNIPKSILFALGIYAVYFFAFVIINILISLFLPAIDSDQKQQLGFPDPKGYEYLLIFIILTVFPALIEEIIFRGMIFTKLQKVIDWKWAAIITSIVFGLLHLEFLSGESLNWIAAIDTGVFSIFLCSAYFKSRSLWTPIIMHFIKNSLAFVVLFVIKYNG